jgi:hypothetical protein
MDLKKTNPALKKSSTAHAKSVETILKKNVSAVLKARKVLVKVRILLKSFIKRLAKALIKEVIILGITSASASGRIIRLL